MTRGPRVFTPSYYQRLYALEQVHGWSRGMRALGGVLLAPFFERATGCRILDAGCGTGGTLSWLQNFHGTSSIGIDLSTHALAFCRQRGHPALAQGSVTALPAQGQSFDLVVCTDVLQHLPHETHLPGDAAALAEAYRVLRPGGYLYVRTNSSFGMGQPPAGDPASYHRYTRSELYDRLRSAGFAVERATYANCLASLLAIARRRLRPPPARRSTHGPGAHDPGMSVRLRPPALRWLDDALFWLLRLEARYVGQLRRDLPFGHSLVALARKPRPAMARPRPPG